VSEKLLELFSYMLRTICYKPCDQFRCLSKCHQSQFSHAS